MIPRLDISGLGQLSPWLWPMGICGVSPRAMTVPVAGRWRFEYSWDEGGRLLEVRGGPRPDRVSHHFRYGWAGDLLERIEQLDEHAELGSDVQDTYVWRWDGDRPTAMTQRGAGGAPPPHVWTWDDTGRRARITHTSPAGVRSARSVVYDEAGRLVHIENEKTEPGLVADGTIERVVDIKWAADGRILSARAATGPGLADIVTVTYRWDDQGRLVAQSSTQYPGVDMCVYHYDDPS